MVCSKDRLRSFGVLRTPQDDNAPFLRSDQPPLRERCCLFSYQYVGTLLCAIFVRHNRMQVLCFVCRSWLVLEGGTKEKRGGELRPTEFVCAPKYFDTSLK